MSHVLHSSEIQSWCTPPAILDRVRRVGPIAFDPASGPTNPTGAARFCSPEAPIPEALAAWAGPCGLRATWPPVGMVWINSPYGPHLSGPVRPERKVFKTVKGVKIHVGTGTGWAARIAAHPGERLCIAPNRTEAAWFETLHAASALRIELLSRVAFVHPETGLVGKSPNHGSIMFYDPGPRGLDGVRAACEAFTDIARLLPGGRRIPR